ncbi:hypothetical protein IFM89_006451, partial [Coptis chinensis]
RCSRNVCDRVKSSTNEWSGSNWKMERFVQIICFVTTLWYLVDHEGLDEFEIRKLLHMPHISTPSLDIDSCNGLVFVHEPPYCVSNPITGDFIMLPKSPKYDKVAVVSGFGFDPITSGVDEGLRLAPMFGRISCPRYLLYLDTAQPAGLGATLFDLPVSCLSVLGEGLIPLSGSLSGSAPIGLSHCPIISICGGLIPLSASSTGLPPIGALSLPHISLASRSAEGLIHFSWLDRGSPIGALSLPHISLASRSAEAHPTQRARTGFARLGLSHCPYISSISRSAEGSSHSAGSTGCRPVGALSLPHISLASISGGLIPSPRSSDRVIAGWGSLISLVSPASIRGGLIHPSELGRVAADRGSLIATYISSISIAEGSSHSARARLG